MPRDVLGRYTLPAGNPVVSGTIISDTWANTTLSDIALALTNSLPKDGSVAMSAPLKFTDGNAASPAVTFANDASTGVYKPVNSVLGFSTGGSERIRIDASGNLGVGTTNPTAKLDVNGNAAISSNAAIGGDASVGGTATVSRMLGIGRTPAHSLDIGNDTGQQVIRVNGAGSGDAAGASLYLKTGAVTHSIGNYSAIVGGTYNRNLTLWSGAGDTIFATGGSERVRIDLSGNVGIGTNNPGTMLQLKGQANTISGLANRAAYFAVANTNSSDAGVVIGSLTGNAPYIAASKLGDGTATPMLMYTNDTERMRIDASGNVGIGTASPNSKLSVYNASGSAQFRVGASPNYFWDISRDNDSTGNLWISNYNGSGSQSTRMVIDNNGNVGIGESNPSSWSSKLVVKGASGYVQTTVACSGNSASDVSGITATAGSSGYSAAMQAYGDGFVQLNLNGAAGKERRTTIFSSNSIRWTYGSDGAAESGSNAGSNFFIVRFADNGAYLGKPFEINRSTGAIRTEVEGLATSLPSYSVRSWANFSGAGTVGAAATIKAGYAVSSITKTASSVFSYNFANAMPDTNYMFFGSGRQAVDSSGPYAPVIVTWLSDSKTTTSFTFRCMYSNQAVFDSPEIHIAVVR